ncbi:MAG: DUF2066 domain-containing protein [Gammaproteobacteria bacterium]|nr:DUF2066 domain-containing protein [Gammaproteobacteria bacterium]
MKKNIKKTIFLLCIFFSTGLFAAKVQNLYSVQLPISSRSQNERHQAILKAFKIVLIKVSGDPQTIQQPQISTKLKNATQYVQEYSYDTIQDNLQNTPVLNVTFDAQAIDQLLKQNGLFIWKDQRPSIIVWIVIKTLEGLNMMPANETLFQVQEALNKVALARGLLMLFPTLDFTDLKIVQPSDIWIPFLNVLQTASKRYQADSILIIRIDASQPGTLQSHWAFVLNNAPQAWDITASTTENIVQEGMNHLSDFLLNQAKNADVTQQNQIQVNITNLKNVSDYIHIFQYLRKLKNVVQVSALNTSKTQADFQLVIKGNIQQLREELSSSIWLQDITDDLNNMNDFDNPVQLEYALKEI